MASPRAFFVILDEKNGKIWKSKSVNLLSRYILRQVLANLTICLLVFTSLLLLGNILKEIFDLLASQQAPISAVLKALALLIPFVLAFSLPISLLTAVLLVFGRLSSEQELTAMRSGGISLLQVSLPVLVLSLVLSVVSGVFNLKIAPECRLAFKRLHRALAKDPQALSFVGENSYTQLRDLDIYIGRIDGETLREVLVYQYTNNMKWLECRAERGALVHKPNEAPTALRLYNATAYHRAPGPGDEWNPTFAPVLDVPLPATPAEDPKSIDEMPFGELLALRESLLQKKNDATPVRIRIHRQLSLSLGCFGFALVGIPLAIRTHRRETNIGVAIALGLVLLYYSFTIVAQSLQTKPEYHPHLIVWIPALLFQGVGAWLLWRANRRG